MRNQDRFNVDQAGALSGGRMPIYLAFASSGYTKNGTAVASSSNYKMSASDHVIIATSAESDGTAIITLPPKAEACGKFYSIYAPTGASAGDISVYDKEAGSEWSTNGDLDADADALVAYCNGAIWIALNAPA